MQEMAVRRRGHRDDRNARADVVRAGELYRLGDRARRRTRRPSR